MTWFLDNLTLIVNLLRDHIVLSVIPIVAGFVISLPIGWAASRKPRLRGTLLSLGGIMYAIPSLPLFLVLPAIIGTGILDPLNVGIALTMYAVALMIRASADAFGAVSPAVLDSAAAAGFSPRQRFFRVELPLAGPVLLAGVRVVSVSTVSLVSIGPLIGVRNLGSLFTDGFQRGFLTEIIIGMVLIIVLAVVFDVILVALARVLMPWQRVLAQTAKAAA